MFLQASWRAYRTRQRLPEPLSEMVLRRRATLLVQRAYRWLMLKRRFTLLSSALKCTPAPQPKMPRCNFMHWL